MQKLSKIIETKNYMKKKRLDLLATEIDKEGKTRWVRVGFAIPSTKHNGYSLKLHLFDRWFILRESLYPADENNTQ